MLSVTLSQNSTLSDLINTLFDISADENADESAQTDSYLKIDAKYQQFGISAPTNASNDSAAKLESSKLYDFTRQMLNCLGLLSIKSSECIAPKMGGYKIALSTSDHKLTPSLPVSQREGRVDLGGENHARSQARSSNRIDRGRSGAIGLTV
jgi:hypothetical protein